MVSIIKILYILNIDKMISTWSSSSDHLKLVPCTCLHKVNKRGGAGGFFLISCCIRRVAVGDVAHTLLSYVLYNMSTQQKDLMKHSLSSDPGSNPCISYCNLNLVYSIIRQNK